MSPAMQFRVDADNLSKGLIFWFRTRGVLVNVVVDIRGNIPRNSLEIHPIQG